MAFPKGKRPLRMYFSSFTPVAVGHGSGLEIFAPEDGKGFFWFAATPGDSVPIGFTISESPILDSNFVTITPTALSNFDPKAAPSLLIRTGTADGVVAKETDYFLSRTNAVVIGRKTSAERGDVFVPPGARLTILKVALERDLEISMGVEEL